MSTATAAGFTAGQEATWTGTKHLFEHRVTIIASRLSWLEIFGETPEDGRTVHDIWDPAIGTTVLGIPAEQLQAVTS